MSKREIGRRTIIDDFGQGQHVLVEEIVTDVLRVTIQNERRARPHTFEICRAELIAVVEIFLRRPTSSEQA